MKEIGNMGKIQDCEKSDAFSCGQFVVQGIVGHLRITTKQTWNLILNFIAKDCYVDLWDSSITDVAKNLELMR